VIGQGGQTLQDDIVDSCAELAALGVHAGAVALGDIRELIGEER
jgi:hypothetical protein